MSKSKAKNGARTGSKKQQTEIPGTQDPDQLPALDDACADFLNARGMVLGARKEMLQLKTALIALMVEHKRKRYVYRDGVFVFVFTTPSKTELHSRREHVKKAEAKRPKRARSAPEVMA